MENAYIIGEHLIIVAPRWQYGSTCLEPTGQTRVWYEPIEDEL